MNTKNRIFYPQININHFIENKIYWRTLIVTETIIYFNNYFNLSIVLDYIIQSYSGTIDKCNFDGSRKNYETPKICNKGIY